MASFSWHEISTREKLAWLLVVFLMTSLPSNVQGSTNDDVNWQLFQIYKANISCSARIANATVPTDGGIYCEPVWDNVMCWPYYLKAGENASQPCPTYIHRFNPFEKASRFCTEDGTWEKHPNDNINSSWTDFRNCLKKIKSTVPAVIEMIEDNRSIFKPSYVSNPKSGQSPYRKWNTADLKLFNQDGRKKGALKKHMPIVIKISTIGYSISLCTLIVATSIMTFFRKLHCQRNTIHINLFFSFMLRAITSLLKNSLLVKHLALPSDVKYEQDGNLAFIHEGTHWECKLLNTLWQYSLNANYMWIFVEGLYLHTLIFFAIFSQSSKFFKLYIIIGWVLPFIFIICWVMARIFKNNTLCWNTHDKGFYWILNAPIVSSISVNFFFFLNIIRVLFTKIRDCNTRDPRRYRKLAKSTLVLIPLFGVYYIFFIVLSMHQEPKTAVIHMYMEMTLNSFQGTVVALLFCFMNGEVRSEITKKWHRHWLRRQSVVSGFSSWAFSTSSFYTGKERHSLSNGHPLCDVASKEETSPSHHNHNNGRMFHKVSSMPKLSQSYYPNIKSIPRVSSSSKVTFYSTQDIMTVSVGSHCYCEDRYSQKPDKAKLSNGDSQLSNQDESKSLLPDHLNATNQESLKTKVLSTTSLKDLSSKSDTNVINFKGINEDSRPVVSRIPNGLPPLLDEDEDT